MKKRLIILICICITLLVGCTKKDANKIVSDLSKKINDLSSYNLKGDLEIINGEDMYLYDVEVSYKKNDLFRVSLTNTNNNHVQILLKNTEGVFVLTPSLNKSFKFQSDWPYNNSQIYLYQTIIKDIENDKDHFVDLNGDDYVITSKVNYANNNELKNQKVYVNKDLNIYKVEVLDENGLAAMIMNFTSIDLKPTYSDDYFELNNSLNTSTNEEEIKTTSKIDTIIYPLYLPSNTHLISQDILNKDQGERVILTFDGDNSFMLIEETANINKELTTVPVYGEPIHIADTLGVASDNSVTWYSSGIEYYITSSNLSESELVSIANSINALPVVK